MLTLFLAILGLILSIILLSFHARKFPSSVYLSIFFFLVSLYALTQWAFYYSNSPVLVGVLYMNFSFLAYLIGPFLYWYIRSSIKDDFHFKKKDIWHFIPSLIFLVTSIPYILTSWSYKLYVASLIISDIHYLRILEPSILYHLVPNSMVYLSRDILVFAYLSWSILIFIRFLKQEKGNSVIFRQRYMTRWLIVFLVFLFLLVFGHLISASRAIAHQDPDLLYAVSLLRVIAGIGLTGLLVSPFFFPGILYGLPHIPEVYLYKGKEDIYRLM